MMNLADPELELIDPTPNVHTMFLHFDKTFFWAKLSSRCVVRWSKRMYSCAGTCSYEGRGGLCYIALSEPLLKLRPRKDMVETLLHEMIHAYLFITHRDQDRDGHGPIFQAHMHRINRAAGLNISIYHDFHDEVKLYQTHWWRCDGPCKSWRPHFGIVRRSANRPPSKNDFWWNEHKRICGGNFIKIKEPEKSEKKSKNTIVAKPIGDIRKYINNNNSDNEVCDMNSIGLQNNKIKTPILKDTSILPAKSNVTIKDTPRKTLVVNKKNVVFNPLVQKPVPFSGTARSINGKNQSTNPANVLDSVRELWAKKQLGTTNMGISKSNNTSIAVNTSIKHKTYNNIKDTLSNLITLTPSKHKADAHTETPPPKMKKIDDYFKTTATSVLKDLYGQDFQVTQSKNTKKLIAIPTERDLVNCPVCGSKVSSCDINKHLDECLNKSVIEKICNEKGTIINQNEFENNVNNRDKSIETGKKERNIPKVKEENILSSSANKITGDTYLSPVENGNNVMKGFRTSFDGANLAKVNSVNNKKFRKSDGFVTPSIVDKVQISKTSTASNIQPSIKTEPSCSNNNLAIKKKCPCCGSRLNKTLDEHLNECLSFFNNNTTKPKKSSADSFVMETIVIDDDDDDKFDETLTMNATGTKLPCPCCMMMVEEIDMNNHLDVCLISN